MTTEFLSLRTGTSYFAADGQDTISLTNFRQDSDVDDAVSASTDAAHQRNLTTQAAVFLDGVTSMAPATTYAEAEASLNAETGTYSFSASTDTRNSFADNSAAFVYATVDQFFTYSGTGQITFVFDLSGQVRNASLGDADSLEALAQFGVLDAGLNPLGGMKFQKAYQYPDPFTGTAPERIAVNETVSFTLDVDSATETTLYGKWIFSAGLGGAGFAEMDLAAQGLILPSAGVTLSEVAALPILTDSYSGTTADDVHRGTKTTDYITGMAGNDELSAMGGNDTVKGGDGHDLLKGGRGQDNLSGDAGDDALRGQRDADKLYGGAGNDNLKGGGGNDTLEGGADNDFLRGGTRRDEMFGGAGHDMLIGNSFDDLLEGGDGNDRLLAGGDNDTLNGGMGDDSLKGGSGQDTFVFERGGGSDLFYDFNIATDRLHLVGFDITAQEVELSATVQGRQTVLDFGQGDMITLDRLANVTGLADVIEIL